MIFFGIIFVLVCDMKSNIYYNVMYFMWNLYSILFNYPLFIKIIIIIIKMFFLLKKRLKIHCEIVHFMKLNSFFNIITRT